MPGTRLLPARPATGLRAALQGVHPARRGRPADPAGAGRGGHRRRAVVHHRSGHHGAAPVVLADDRGLQPAENITPLVRRDVIVRYGPNLLAALNKLSALLDTGTLRALDAQVELDGQGPRSVARAWLRAHGLIPQGGAVH